MSNSEDDSSAEVKNKVQDTPHLKSTEKSLKTDSALQNAKEDYEASAAPSYFKQQTEKISIKPDLPNVRISEDIKKSTKAAQKMPVEAVSWQNRKSCSQDSSERYKDSKKTSEIKPGTSKRISEDKCSSHLSDTSRNLSTTSSKIKTQLISDAFKTAPTDKSVFKLIASELEVEAKRIDLLLARNVDLTKCEVQRVLYPTVVSEEVAESSPTAQSGCVKQKIGKQNQPSLNQEKSQNVQTNPLDSVREVANAKKSKTSTNASASKDYKYPPGTYYAEPLKKGPDSPSVKSIVKIFEDMTLQEDCRKEMERKQRLGKSKDSKQRISDIAPEKIQSSSITRTSFPNERSFISPGKVQPRSRINLSNERISSFISTESKTRTGVPNTKMSLIDSDKTPPRSKARKSLPNKRTSPLINKEKAQPRRRTRISFPNESTRLSRPEKGQLSSRARTSFLDDGKYSLISPEMVRSISRTNLSNEKISLMNTENNRTIGITNKRISPLTGTETNQPSKTKISFPDARDSSVISPEKIPLGSEERISLLNEKTSLSSPEKVQLGSETIGIPNKRISPLIGTVTNQPSKTKISLPDARSVISPEDIQLGSKARISPLNEKTLSSPEKSQLGSRSRINLLNENSLPKKQSENVTVPSYAGRPGIAASDTQPSIQSNTVPAVRTLKYEEIRSSSTERQSDSKDAEFPGCLSSENKDLAQYSFEFQGAIAIEHPSTNTETEALKDSTESITLRSRANTSGEISSPSIGPAENVFCVNQLDEEREMTSVSREQPSKVPGCARSKLSIGVRPGRNFRRHFAQRDTFEGSLDSLDYITLKGMKNLDLLLVESEKRYGGKYLQTDWVDSTEEAQEIELATLRKRSRILNTELEETRKEIEAYPEDSGSTAVEPLQQRKPTGSEQEMDSPGQKAVGGELENTDLCAQPMSPNALFEMLQEIKIDRRFDAWMELLRIFYTIGRVHTANELKTVMKKIYDEKVTMDFYDYWTHHRQARRNSTKGGYFEVNDLLFRRLKGVTSRMGEMTMAMLWLDIRERTRRVIHAQKQLREESATLHNVRLTPPSNSDSSKESRSESSSNLNQKESSKEPQTISSQKLQEHVKIGVGGDKKPKEIDRGKVLGSKPTSEIGSSKEFSLEEKLTPRFDRVCKENLLLKELMRRKRTNSPFREKRDVSVDTPGVDSVASPRIGSSGDLLSKCTQIKDKDASGETFLKHSDAQEVENSENNLKNLHTLPLNEPDDRELLKIFDKLFGDMFASFIQNNMNNV